MPGGEAGAPSGNREDGRQQRQKQAEREKMSDGLASWHGKYSVTSLLRCTMDGGLCNDTISYICQRGTLRELLVKYALHALRKKKKEHL